MIGIKDKMQAIVQKIQRIFKKDFVVGLDIGTSSVKVAQFIKKEDGLHLINVALREIKSLEGEAQQEEIVSALKNLFKGIDLIFQNIL